MPRIFSVEGVQMHSFEAMAEELGHGFDRLQLVVVHTAMAENKQTIFEVDYLPACAVLL